MLHLSFRDFLVDKEMRGTNPFWIDEQETHERLATRCLDLLCSGKHLKQDICDLGWPGTRREDVDKEDINLRLPGEVRYACLYWTHHLEGSCLKISDSNRAFSFLKDCFLFWLEALALLGEAHKCSSMLVALQSLVDVSHFCFFSFQSLTWILSQTMGRKYPASYEMLPGSSPDQTRSSMTIHSRYMSRASYSRQVRALSEQLSRITYPDG
jgi:hypothetical protein